MQLWRYHGLGNDYLVMEGPQAPSTAMVRALCDRHRGVGSDGILWGTLEPPYRLRPLASLQHDAASSVQQGVTLQLI